MAEFRIPEQILPFIYAALISFTIYLILTRVSRYELRVKFFTPWRIKFLSSLFIFIVIACIGFSSYNLYSAYGGTSIDGVSAVSNSDIAVSNYILGAHPTGSVIWVPQPPQFEFLFYGGTN